MLQQIQVRLRALLRRDRVEQELDEELRLHLEREIELNLAAGMPPEEARRAAQRGFGGVEQLKEECRDARGVRWVDEFGQDLRYGLRVLLRNPGFTLVAVLTLALGIGANTAIFSVVNAVLLRELPYKDASRLVMLWTSKPKTESFEMRTSVPNFEDWKAQTHVFEDLAFYASLNHATLMDPTSEASEPEVIWHAGVAENFFQALGVAPVHGRAFTREEWAAGERVAVMSHALWQRRYGASPGILGKKVHLEGADYQVIGIMPRDFRFPEPRSISGRLNPPGRAGRSIGLTAGAEAWWPSGAFVRGSQWSKRGPR